ncbi:hypothetical protein ACFQ05_04115 [Amycolatopsis umgeniensis]|uniref:Uncharacterized protein n=1 Tax=Amycolatopsis umgeniensis TaxID=336628 RepID=A0A841B0V4_9PSEU|nr:hypothetical protein [Amycolatopsis umgeniensis]MBB5852450.1 hypothetical protein [Amycolatopsis umgeniensis]
MDRIDADLVPGERLLWSGKPQRIPLLVKNDLILLPAVLVIGGVILGGVRNGFSPLLWGVLMLVGGVWLGRPVLRYAALRTASYGITDRRVIVWTNGKDAVAHYLTDLGPPYVRENPDGTGTVCFNLAPADFVQTTGRGWVDQSWSDVGLDPKYPELLNIEHPMVVRDLIASAQQGDR